jgi:hypothetical protein
MSNDIVPTAAPGLSKSNRRLFLVAGTAAALTVTLKSAALLATEPDPIFAAIEQHRLVRAAAYDGEHDPSDEISDREEELLQELGKIEPTTIAGAAALLSYMVDVEGYFVDANSPLVPTINCVVAALEKLEAAHV